MSRPRSTASAAQIRSCWSPETCQSDETSESGYEDEQQADQEQERGQDGDDTIHAPQIRRESIVVARVPRAESIYQRCYLCDSRLTGPCLNVFLCSFICPSTAIVTPPPAKLTPSPRSSSLARTWGPSTGSEARLSNDRPSHQRNLYDCNASSHPELTLFPPPVDLRSLASPPPRPDTSSSRRFNKVKSFFGRLGFGASR